MNKVILMGRLTRDPDIRYSGQDNQTNVVRYTLAVDRRFKKEDGPTADFINCVAFGKTGEFAEKYFKQGQRVLVVGRIQTGSYTNKEGQKVYTTDVVVDEQEFADNKKSDSQGTPSDQNEKDASIMDGFMQIPDGVEDEGLPFN